MDSSAVSARLIGAIFVEKGLITEEQLELALEQQRATGDRIGEILVEQFGIERLDLASALAEQWAEYERQGSAEERAAQAENHELAAGSDESQVTGSSGAPLAPSGKRPIGEIFVERGLVTDEQLGEALEQQKTSGTRLGEILVASGKLSRLELASALADQWASFQKLRPPTDAPPAEAQPASGGVLPTPDVVTTPPVATVSAEVASRVDALASRIDQIAAEKSDWKPQVEKSAELLRARIEHLEEIVARQPEGADDALRAELAKLAERVEAIPAPAPSDEWRSELAQVAENLRARVERVEQVSAAEQLTELRVALDGLAERVESLPRPSEEWRDAVEELAGRIDSLPAPSEEWRAAIEELRTRIESLPAPSEDWRDAIEGLKTQIESLPRPSEEWREAFHSLDERIGALSRPADGDTDFRASLEALAARVDSLPRPSEEWREQVADLSARIEALPMDAWRPELAEVAENLRTRVERVEQRASGGEELAELRGWLESLAVRVDSLHRPSEEWRYQVADVAARIDALPADDWRAEITQVADGLRQRIERIEHGMAGQARAEAVAELAEQVGELARKVADADAIEARLQALGAQIQALPAFSDDWREPLAQLTARIESLPVPSEEWRGRLAELAARVDGLRTDEWKPELAQLAENVRTRIERIEHELGGGQAEQLDRLQSEFAELAGRFDAIPEPAGELGTEFTELAHTLQARMEQVEQRLAHKARTETLDGVLSRIDEIAAKVEEAAAVEPRLYESLSALVHERVDQLQADDAGARGRLEDALRQLAALTGVAGRVDEIEGRLETNAADGAGLDLKVDELRERAEQHTRRFEKLNGRIEELAARGRADELEEVLAARIGAIEGAVAEVRAALDAVPASSEERLAAAEARAATASRQASTDVESLRRELDDLRGVVNAANETAGGRIEDVFNTLRGEMAAVGERFVEHGALAELRSAIERQDGRIDGIGGELASLERRADEQAAGGTAELGSLRTRLEAVETALSHAGGWRDAVDETRARIEHLELRLVESSTAEAVERDANIEALRTEVSERVGALENAQVKRKDVRDLREALERVERRVDDQTARDDAATRAVEEAVRAGLAGLGERLTATEETYLDAGRALRSSIEGLGRTIAGADAHLAGESFEAETAQLEATSYVAFAPTPEGYRLVVCDGGAPALGGQVEIPEYEGVLVVTRVGASPLPFDTRPCVYHDAA